MMLHPTQELEPPANPARFTAQRRDQLLVQAHLVRSTVETLDQYVLLRFFGGHAVPIDLAVLLPFRHRVRRHLGSFVIDDEASVAVCRAPYVHWQPDPGGTGTPLVGPGGPFGFSVPGQPDLSSPVLWYAGEPASAISARHAEGQPACHET